MKYYFKKLHNIMRFIFFTLNFIKQSGVQSIGLETRLQPGDMFSWGAHIIVIVAPLNCDSDAYVMVESGPNVVRFGIAYFESAIKSDIESAVDIATEANELIGGLSEVDKVRKSNMNYCKFTSSDPELSCYHDCGRINVVLKDYSDKVDKYDKPINELNAIELIQYVIDNLPSNYISGLENYNGGIFNTNNLQMFMTETTEYSNDSNVVSDKLILSIMN